MMSIHWRDLPLEDYSHLLGCSADESRSLTERVARYHKIPKNQRSELDHRIQSLKGIINELGEMARASNRPHVAKNLKEVSEIAKGKQFYLQKIKEMYESKQDALSAQESYHLDCRELKDKMFQPITMTNEKRYSIRMRDFWGFCWLESLDPCHRRLIPFHDRWLKARQSDPKTPSFFLWLETEDVPHYTPRIDYLNVEERVHTLVQVKDGLLTIDNRPVDCSDSRYLFVIDLAKNLYVAKGTDRLFHSSFTSGRPVLGAGLINAHEGRLTKLALESGHYLTPLETAWQILHLLDEKGVRFPDSLEFSYFLDYGKYTAYLSKNDWITPEKLNLALREQRECYAALRQAV